MEASRAGKRLKFVLAGTSAGPTMKWPTGRHASGSTGTGTGTGVTPKMAARLDCICGHCTYAALDIGASGLFRLLSFGVACGIKYALEMLKNALKSKLDSNHK